MLEADRQAVIAQELPLTREEGERFWPVYRKFHAEAAKIMGRRLSFRASGRRIPACVAALG